MVQIVNRPPTAGQLLGQGLGEGFSKTLGDRLQEKRQKTQMEEGLAKLDNLGDIEDMDTFELQKEIYKAFPGNPDLAKNLSAAVQQKKEQQIQANKKRKDQKHIARLEKRAGVEEGALGEDVKNAEFLFKDMKEKKKEEKDVLKLNEELNQQKSRSKARIDDIVRPYGMIDPITRMITWIGKPGEEKMKEIFDKVEKERSKSEKTQKALYKQYGQSIPEDLNSDYKDTSQEDSARSDKVQQVTEMLRQLVEAK